MAALFGADTAEEKPFAYDPMEVAAALRIAAAVMRPGVIGEAIKTMPNDISFAAAEELIRKALTDA